jgi:acyl-CoA synthetase (AMP-forming)/AMP-acid ligase II
MLDATVREAAARFGDAAALVAPEGWAMSFEDLDRVSDEAAAGLAALGIRPGDVVALALPSSPDYAVAYAALAKLGAVAVGLNPRSTGPERAAMVAVVAPQLVLATRELAEGLSDNTPIEPVERADHVEKILASLRRGQTDQSPAELPPDPDRLVTIVLTSGTTGVPKGAMFGARELAAVTEADTQGRWGGGAPMLSGTQLAHVGFMTKLPWYLRTASTVHVVDRWRAHDVLRLIADNHMPSIGGIAAQLALLLREPDFDHFDLSAVKTIVMGGALSPPALVREARARIGAAYSIRYSSTESGGIGTATAFDADDDEALFTVGRPRPGVQVEIRDPDGRAVTSGEVGEICLRSPTQLRGYCNDPDATRATIRDGWVHSGDLGRIDESGCLRLAGRAKEMFIRGGYNVFPLEVEGVLASHPEVVDVVVVPRPDPVMGEIGVAVVVPRDPARPPTLDDLRREAGTRLSSHKLPEAMRIVETLPLTPMQKVDRQALAAAEVSESGHGNPST